MQKNYITKIIKIFLISLVVIFVSNLLFNIFIKGGPEAKIDSKSAIKIPGFSQIEYQINIGEDKIVSVSAENAFYQTKGSILLNNIFVRNLVGDFDLNLNAIEGEFNEENKELHLRKNVLGYYNDVKLVAQDFIADLENNNLRSNGLMEVKFEDTIFNSSKLRYKHQNRLVEYAEDIIYEGIINEMNIKYVASKIEGKADSENNQYLSYNTDIKNQDSNFKADSFFIEFSRNEEKEFFIGDVTKAEAVGNVDAVAKEGRILADEFLYEAGNSDVVFKNNVKATSNDGQSLDAGLLVYNIASNYVKFARDVRYKTKAKDSISYSAGESSYVLGEELNHIISKDSVIISNGSELHANLINAQIVKDENRAMQFGDVYSADGEGDIKLKNNGVLVNSDKFKYNAKKGHIDLFGNVKLTNKEGKNLSANELSYDIVLGAVSEVIHANYTGMEKGKELGYKADKSNYIIGESQNKIESENVEVKYSDITLKADKVISVTERDDKLQQKMGAILHAEGYGNIEAFDKDKNIKSDKFFYDAKENKIYFRKNVILVTNSGTGKGGELQYDLNTGDALFTKGRFGSKTKLIIKEND